MVLMTELLFGTGKLSGESKPVECVRNYKEKFDAILNEKNINDSSAENATTHYKSLKGSKLLYSCFSLFVLQINY